MRAQGVGSRVEGWGGVLASARVMASVKGPEFRGGGGVGVQSPGVRVQGLGVGG